ncbi:DnaB: replicative DNA helicase [Gaiella occulta]|uniref:Replicative DNA helicase n=2 Tax=Gaiella occulta TaxID=1002870 RepID=A0A7M2Z0V0_9ACTN|nr:DnaB: replicative DNA helicase [Gaiella occulta]
MPSAIVPPQNLEAEESVLGAMLLSPTAIGAVTEILDASDFYRESHGTIYRAALALYGKGEPVDAITLANELDERGELERVGGSAKIAELAALVPAASNAEHYARIVKEMATLRGLVRVGQEITRLGQDRPGQTTDLVDRAEQMVFELASERVSGDFAHIESLLKESFERIMHLYEAGVEITGIPSGFRELDKLTSGFQPGNLIILAARPSMGKSALALCAAANLGVRHETPVALFTLEMSKAEVTQRMMCSEAKVESQRLRSGRLGQDDWPRLTAACDKLMKAPIYVDDTGSITMMELRSKARRLKSREPKLGMIIVDYLQLMTSGSNPENRVQEVSQISRSLKVLARDLEVPILALSQLSRAVEQRHDKRPILSDLRESGCLAGETPVYLPDEGVHRPIRDLVGTSGFNVLALDESTWQLEPRRVTHAFATGRKPVFLLRTRRGRTIRATANHKFLAFDRWRRLDELAPGTQIALPRRLDTRGDGARTMSDAELALLGHLIGDGCTLPRHAIRYTTREPELAALVADLAEAVFGDVVAPRVKAERTWYQVDLPATARLTHGVRNPVAAWLDGLGVFGLRSYEKRVPDEVFRQPVEAIETFLRHLWATGGCLRAGDERAYAVVRYDTTSEELAYGVVSLLLRLGITAGTRVVSMGAKGRPSHRVDVTGRDDVLRFLSFVGATGERRGEARREILGKLAVAAGTTNRDTPPRATWKGLVVPATASAGVTARQLQERLGMRYCGSTLYKAGISRARAERVAEIADSSELRSLARSDVCWDEVVAVTPDGEEEVYDLTVDELHNFVAANTIVHNSIEQDADLVMFVYRDEYYNGEESDAQGLAEIILAKHRNGPTDAIKLSFLKRYAKFADLAAS